MTDFDTISAILTQAYLEFTPSENRDQITLLSYSGDPEVNINFIFEEDGKLNFIDADDEL